MAKTTEPLKLKDGSTIPVGSEVEWERDFACIAGKRISHLGAARALGCETPSMEQLESWVSDSLVDSVLGHLVEPDGYDHEGSPSWLIALKLI